MNRVGVLRFAQDDTLKIHASAGVVRCQACSGVTRLRRCPPLALVAQDDTGVSVPNLWRSTLEQIETQETTKRIDVAVMVGEYGALKSSGMRKSIQGRFLKWEGSAAHSIVAWRNALR